MAEKLIPGLPPQKKFFGQPVFNNLAERTIRSHVDLHVAKDVEQRIQTLIEAGGVPFVIANHQGHADAMAFAVVANYFRNLMRGIDGIYAFNGMAAPMAKSWAEGQQGGDLKNSYELLRPASSKMGMEGIPQTRVKDGVYGMERKQGNMISETKPLVYLLKNGYGIELLPEGSVQAGRHPEGANIEEIYGMQEVRAEHILKFYDLINHTVSKFGRWAFEVPLGLHGSFRLVNCPIDVKETPKLTGKGKASLLLGGFGLPLMKIQANLLMPFTDDHIVADLGNNWRDDVPAFNAYVMRRIAQGIPPHARGFYGK